MVSKVYVVDRDEKLVNAVQQIVSESPFFVSAGSSTNFTSAIRDIKSSAPDIIVSGTSLDNNFSAWHLKAEVPNIPSNYIFLSDTDSKEQFLRSREVRGSKFLVKPFGMYSLKGMMEDMHEDIIRFSTKLHAKNNMLFIKKNKVYSKIKLEDVLYFFSEGNYITLYTAEQKYIFKYALSKLLSLEKFRSFVRVHRSYAVNSAKVSEVSLGNKFLMVDQVKIPFGRTFVQDVRKLMDLGLK